MFSCPIWLEALRSSSTMYLTWRRWKRELRSGWRDCTKPWSKIRPQRMKCPRSEVTRILPSLPSSQKRSCQKKKPRRCPKSQKNQRPRRQRPRHAGRCISATAMLLGPGANRSRRNTSHLRARRLAKCILTKCLFPEIGCRGQEDQRGA